MMVVPNLVVLMSLVLFLLTLRWANSLSLFLFSCRNCGGFDKLGLFQVKFMVALRSLDLGLAWVLLDFSLISRSSFCTCNILLALGNATDC